MIGITTLADGVVSEDGVECRLAFAVDLPDADFYQLEFGDIGGPAIQSMADLDAIGWVLNVSYNALGDGDPWVPFEP